MHLTKLRRKKRAKPASKKKGERARFLEQRRYLIEQRKTRLNQLKKIERQIESCRKAKKIDDLKRLQSLKNNLEKDINKLSVIYGRSGK